MLGWRGQMDAGFHCAFRAHCISALISGLGPCWPPADLGFYTNIPVFPQSLSSPPAADEAVSSCPTWCTETVSTLVVFTDFPLFQVSGNGRFRR